MFRQNGRCKKNKIKIKLNSDEYLSYKDYYVYRNVFAL